MMAALAGLAVGFKTKRAGAAIAPSTISVVPDDLLSDFAIKSCVVTGPVESSELPKFITPPGLVLGQTTVQRIADDTNLVTCFYKRSPLLEYISKLHQG